MKDEISRGDQNRTKDEIFRNSGSKIISQRKRYDWSLCEIKQNQPVAEIQSEVILEQREFTRTGATAATTRGLDTRDVKHMVDCKKLTEVEE